MKPAEGLYLLEDVEINEVCDELVDERHVDVRIEGVARKVVREVVEDLGDAAVRPEKCATNGVERRSVVTD